MSEAKHHQANYKGWLYKWTNYLKGYQKRWFVLQNGLLSYYRNQAEMAHTCRGTINLANASIQTEDSTTIVISNGGAQTFHLKAASEVDRQKWIMALELAKTEAKKMADAVIVLDSESDEEEVQQPDKAELNIMLHNLSVKLQDLNTCNDLIAKHGHALTKTLSELEATHNPADAASNMKSVQERATLFRITVNAMINACSEFNQLSQTQGKRWQKMIQHEQEQKLKLEEMVEQLAKNVVSLEKKARMSISGIPIRETDSEDDEFVDAPEHQLEDRELMVALPPHTSSEMMHRRTDSMESYPDMSSESDSESSANEARVYMTKTSPKKREHQRTSSQDKIRLPKSTSSDSHGSDTSLTRRKRRRRIPDKPNISLNLWSFMKNAIGKELSKIPMPVNFNEPLSMLQRIMEEMEYSEILDQASKCADSAEQMAWVAAFTVSAYATTLFRVGKPFNPLLGETFEFDRMEDLGWKGISEQVSHHPPMLAMHIDGRDWSTWQEFTMTTKFRGRYLQIIPMGIAHLVFHKTGHHYTWRKVTTTVNNIIVGKLWVDNHGEMDITNHTNGDKCHLKYSAYSYFSRENPRKVTGVVTDVQGNAKWVLTGTWDQKMEAAQIIHAEESNKGKPVFETGPHKTMWKVRPPPPGSERIYFFNQLTIEMNEPEEGVAPTDSRNRPDQRLMEEGQWDEANRVKVRLEEKQREVRKQREAEAEKARAEGLDYPPYKPTWFQKERDVTTGALMHVYNKQYWDCKDRQDWHMCPDIFL
ncbi:oxysterol-binding protein 1-like isoform X2 [Biomphalaria glabrata]|uniref:Oxysterol-binding protein 1-like isoform X2 n=1 Tax=Biomphalaria glabrata TaxID=6526 RepID=A0A9W2YFL6_BIOGL|nr:oxysterol-binding protein 1-like isoform X2 [Biomphalaria glabrata]